MIKMRPLFGLLALLLFVCLVHSCTGDTDSKTVVVFKGGETKVSYKGKNGEKTERTPEDFCVPAFVGGMFKNKEFLAIISAGVSYDTFEYAVFDGAVRTSYEDHNIWSAAEGFTNATEGNKVYRLYKDFTAVMKNDKIYVLATGFYEQAASWTNEVYDDGWNPLMFVGTVGDSAGSAEGGASITWQKGKSLKSQIATELQSAQGTRFFGGVGNGIVTQNGTIVFPIYLGLEKRLRASSILYSVDDGATWKIGKKTENTTLEGSVVEWGEGNLLLIVRSDEGYRRVFESGNMGTTWEESLFFSGVWGSEPNRRKKGFPGSAIKARVDKKDVLFFAHPLTAKRGSVPETLQLWLSDGQRIVRVGTISDKEKEIHTGNSILAHVSDHLYITHVINPYGVGGLPATAQGFSQVIGFTPLPKLFASAKTTVRAWRKLDEWFVSKGVPTEGLVGFLKNTQKDNLQWNDAYKCVDATVSDGESVDDGFRFSGAPESRAEWPVSSQGQNQVYIFANKQFTLAATVTIHTGSENGQFSLIGASLDSQGNNVLFGLGYTHENKWYTVSNGKKEISTQETFEREREYHVALTFANGEASVYVDGKQITSNKLEIQKTAPIRHFYMGGIGDSSTAKGSPCTVKNVILFNHALPEEKIAKLTQVSKEIKLEEEEEETTTALPKSKTEDSTSVTSTDPKESSIPSMQKVTNVKVNDTKIHTYPPDLGDRIFTKNTKGDIAVVGSMSSVGWMFFVCSLVALTGF